ncbi:MAG: hypothetical protein M1818_005440 [Claussenomyces sp. TS43310]|nr:MAG: hypothetical protein M1818_005440 [Claussenomyces sp. TS43310]
MDVESTYRNLQPHVAHVFPQGQPSLSTYGSHQPLSLSGDNEFHQELHCLQNQNPAPGQPYPDSHVFHPHRPQHPQAQSTGTPQTPRQPRPSANSQFGVLTPATAEHNSLNGLHQDGDAFASPDRPDQSHHHASTRIVGNPPNLQEWRQKLFNVDGMITLSEEEFQVYFPHVDNVYSHRSTQRYKRKPFVSHYWDCRLKGRPPGTPKSDDPSKRKRKRTARERDLCDVKIKITEYFPGAMLGPDFVPDGAEEINDRGPNFLTRNHSGSLAPEQQSYRLPMPGSGTIDSHPGSTGQRYYTIQRVNGNGGNGKGDGVAGPHKHSLAESDKVKKNSVQRHTMKQDKEEKYTQKTYHQRASGNALATVKRHAKDHELKLFGSCFCPFVQRVWIALEAKGLQYQYIEVDPYKKPQVLLEVNPRGLVPGIRHGDWGCGESTVLMEYLEDLATGTPLLPVNDPRLRATCRLWSDHISRQIIPAFYGLLQAQVVPQQIENAKKLKEQISLLVEACPDPHGPFFLGQQLSFVDVQFAPWMLRMSRVLKPYRDWPDPEPGSRWARWLQATEANEHVQATTSAEELYVDSYERYAENRPCTSQLADAINAGQALP